MAERILAVLLAFDALFALSLILSLLFRWLYRNNKDVDFGGWCWLSIVLFAGWSAVIILICGILWLTDIIYNIIV